MLIKADNCDIYEFNSDVRNGQASIIRKYDLLVAITRGIIDTNWSISEKVIRLILPLTRDLLY